MSGVLGFPNPDGTLRNCSGCGHTTVLATGVAGNERVHTGTHTPECRPARTTAKAAAR